MENPYITLEDINKLLEFCIYELYEKQNKDFDWKFYLEYIQKKLQYLITNQL